jgi:hypothetical protein
MVTGVGHLFRQHTQARTEDHRYARLEASWETGANNVGCLEWGIIRHGYPLIFDVAGEADTMHHRTYVWQIPFFLPFIQNRYKSGVL